MNWFPLHQHSHFSCLDGLAKPKQIASRCKSLGLSGGVISDHGSLSSVAQFTKAMQKQELKSILGCELYLCEDDPSIKTKENSSLSHLVVLAKNLAGWKNLIKAVNQSNQPEYFYRKPRLNLTKLAEFAGEFVSFSGHPGSDLGNVIFGENARQAYGARTLDEVKSFVVDDAEKLAENLALKYREIFGKENFFLEIQLIDKDNLPATIVIANILRLISKRTNIPCVATADSHYCAPEDAADQRILLCSKFETTLKKVQAKLERDEDVALGTFFRSNKYYIPSSEEMSKIHTQEEIENSFNIANMCEDYNIFHPPIVPNFKCPNGMTENEYLRQLCREGWKQKIVGKVDKSKHQTYVDRINNELGVLDGVYEESGINLSAYFLIVQDFVQWSKNQGWVLSPSRGSAGGCLISYLSNITDVDPIRFDLIFERFYNSGRNTKDRVALPDIDVDFPKFKRPQVIEYIKNKYGHNCVSHMITFGKMLGRSAIKDVLRAHEACSFDEMNKITKYIPGKEEISDQLQLMDEPSIVRWALENNKKELQPWCYIDDDGKFEGRLAKYFEQAIRLEGTNRNQGKHASGLVISTNPLDKTVPMVYDKSDDELIAGLEMEDLESLGQVKFDILGIVLLDKIMGIQQLLETGTIC